MDLSYVYIEMLLYTYKFCIKMRMRVWGWFNVWFLGGVWCLWRRTVPPANGSTTRSAWGETKPADSQNWSIASINTSSRSQRMKQVHIANRKPPGFFILLLFYEKKQAVTISVDILFWLNPWLLYSRCWSLNRKWSQQRVKFDFEWVMGAYLFDFLGKMDFFCTQKNQANPL